MTASTAIPASARKKIPDALLIPPVFFHAVRFGPGTAMSERASIAAASAAPDIIERGIGEDDGAERASKARLDEGRGPDAGGIDDGISDEATGLSETDFFRGSAVSGALALAAEPGVRNSLGSSSERTLAPTRSMLGRDQSTVEPV